MVVGRQTRVDLLASNSEGNLAVIELKRDRTPGEVVAPVLDYASWVEDHSYDRIAEIHRDQNPDSHLDDACAGAFDVPILETLSESHEKKDIAASLYHDPNLSALAARPFSGMIDAYVRITPQDAPRDLEVPSRELAMP